MKLISMTDFVLTKDSTCIFKYANFLKQPLELWMFVPCNNLNEPYPKEADEYFKQRVDDLALKYQQAKERVLFDGFELQQDTYKDVKRKFWYIKDLRIASEYSYWTGEIDLKFDLLHDNKTIEDLVKYNLKLTESAIKQIGL